MALSGVGWLLKVDKSEHHNFLMVVSKIKISIGYQPFPCDRYQGFSGVGIQVMVSCSTMFSTPYLTRSDGLLSW